MGLRYLNSPLLLTPYALFKVPSMENAGVEPATSDLQSRRSPN